jgi:hypothetical protein
MQIQLWSRVFLTRFLTETSRDGAGGQGFREPVKTIGAGEMRRIGCVGAQGLWPCVLITRRSQVQILPPLLRERAFNVLAVIPPGKPGGISHVLTPFRAPASHSGLSQRGWPAQAVRDTPEGQLGEQMADPSR